MRKAIIYCRSATADQLSNAQLSRQQEDCLAYARAHNYEVIEVITEAGLSGLDQSRQGLQKLMALCDHQEVKAVITYDIVRLSRDMGYLNYLMKTLANKHVELVTIKNCLPLTC